MPVVYADAVFLENLAVDYILLVACARIAGVPARRWRAALAAAVGAVYALMSVLVSRPVLTSLAVKAAVGLLMVVVVFGFDRRLLRLALVFFAVSAAFAGAVMAACLVSGRTVDLTSGVSFGTLLLSFAVFYALFTAVFRAVGRHRVRGEIKSLTVTYRGRQVTVPALDDTGNGLTEPVSGLPVTVCSLEAVAPLLEPQVLAILRDHPDPAEAVEALGEKEIYSFFLVPYRAVGVKGGFLPAFRPDSVRVGFREKTTLIAIDAGGLAAGAGYCAVTAA